jgi:glycosyltransferase involved in cell wall biosynthesis
MHILLVHQYFLQKNGTGGSRFNEMVNFWSQEGHQVTVLAGMIYHNSGYKYDEYKGKYFVDEKYAELVRVIRCHDSESGQSSFLSRLKVYLVFVFYSLYAGVFKAKDKYDVIVVTSPPLFVGITGYVLSLVKRVPFVFEIRDLWPESAVDAGVLKNKIIINFALWFENLMYKRAKLINVLTPAFRESLIGDKKVPKDKIIFVPNAADFSLAEVVQQDFDSFEFKRDIGLEGKFVITYVGAHGIANHLTQLICAAKDLQDTNLVIQLIGDGMEKKLLQKKVSEYNMKNVIFLDPVSKKDVFKYILSSDVGASVLKKADTFKTVYSNKTFDYMSCRKPVLLAIDGVSRELINDANCGVYVEPENVSDVKEGIMKLMSMTQEELNLLGENGYSYAQKHFDRRVLAKHYLNALMKIIRM